MRFIAKLLNMEVQFSSHPFGNAHPHTLCPCQANGLVQRYRSSPETFAMISLLVHTPEEKMMGIGHSTCIQGFAKAGLFQVPTSVEIQSLEPSWKHRPVIPCLCTSVYFLSQVWICKTSSLWFARKSRNVSKSSKQLAMYLNRTKSRQTLLG